MELGRTYQERKNAYISVIKYCKTSNEEFVGDSRWCWKDAEVQTIDCGYQILTKSKRIEFEVDSKKRHYHLQNWHLLPWIICKSKAIILLLFTFNRSPIFDITKEFQSRFCAQKCKWWCVHCVYCPWSNLELGIICLCWDLNILCQWFSSIARLSRINMDLHTVLELYQNQSVRLQSKHYTILWA